MVKHNQENFWMAIFLSLVILKKLTKVILR